MQHPFVVPGGRFREFYYVRMNRLVIANISYLLVGHVLDCQRPLGIWHEADCQTHHYQHVRYALLSYISHISTDMVQKFGFFPNGARIYYLNRSQPPLLSEMIYEYYFCTGDNAFLEAALKPLDMVRCRPYFLMPRGISVLDARRASCSEIARRTRSQSLLDWYYGPTSWVLERRYRGRRRDGPSREDQTLVKHCCCGRIWPRF